MPERAGLPKAIAFSDLPKLLINRLHFIVLNADPPPEYSTSRFQNYSVIFPLFALIFPRLLLLSRRFL